jgi:hypothetical protein
LRPVVAQVDGDLTTVGGRCIAVAREHLSLELEHLRLVELE